MERGADQWRIGKDNTALVIVDMQNMWVHPKGARYLPSSEDIIPRIQTLLERFRGAKMAVVYLYTTKRKDMADVGIFADLKPATHQADDPWTNIEGAPGAQIHETVKPLENELVIKKFRYSGFYGTALENVLRRLRCDVIAIVGVATNVCCDSTARDGAMRDFKVVFLSDCNAAFSDEDQNYTLKNFAQHFGLVMDSGTLLARLDAEA